MHTVLPEELLLVLLGLGELALVLAALLEAAKLRQPLREFLLARLKFTLPSVP